MLCLAPNARIKETIARRQSFRFTGINIDGDVKHVRGFRVMIGQRRGIFAQESADLFPRRRRIGSSAGEPTVGRNSDDVRGVGIETNRSVFVNENAALCGRHVAQGAIIIHGGSGVAVANLLLIHGVNLLSLNFCTYYST